MKKKRLWKNARLLENSPFEPYQYLASLLLSDVLCHVHMQRLLNTSTATKGSIIPAWSRDFDIKDNFCI